MIAYSDANTPDQVLVGDVGRNLPPDITFCTSILIRVCLYGLVITPRPASSLCGFVESPRTNCTTEYSTSGPCLALLGIEDNMYSI